MSDFSPAPKPPHSSSSSPTEELELQGIDEDDDFERDFFQGLSGRRQKSAFILTVIWGVTFALYQVSWATLFVTGFTVFFLLQSLRIILAKPVDVPPALTLESGQTAPFVSLLVSGKNEEAVIGKLGKMLCELDYPQDRYEVWMINDGSTDRTAQVLDQLAQDYPQLQVLHRSPHAGGGKCGALNEVMPQLQGEIIGVFDADAQVSSDLLTTLIPYFIEDEKIGAVQTRKAIANTGVNFWTKGQTVEMILDSYYQQQRIAIGGLGELRGNGQFVRRSALERCGGWNEETITDDLDLTLRLHFDHWEIGFVNLPPVYEEGVENAIALWHQRNRWAEGGYQRYLDYWRFILHHPFGWKKRLDLLFFMFLQYLLPSALVPDFLLALVYHRFPLFGLLNSIVFLFSFIGMITGLSRVPQFAQTSFFHKLQQGILGSIYMIHWLIIMPCITARMSIRPKRLKWVKTLHQGSTEEELTITP